jgi:hypothetical protein
MRQMLAKLDLQLENLDKVGAIDGQPTRGKHSRSRSPDKLSSLSNRRHSPEQVKLVKKVSKQRLTIEEHKQLALFEIYQFYARQHLKRDIPFEN